MSDNSQIRNGGCICGHVRYQVTSQPMIVHCCHCRGCQKNSGTAFALNALFEAELVELTSGEVETTTVPTPSGTGQDITRCSKCKIAVWSQYNMGGLREHIRFIRVGTLDEPDQMPPNVHIFTESKQPWVIIPKDDQRVDIFYEFTETWLAESVKRLEKIEKTAGVKIL